MHEDTLLLEPEQSQSYPDLFGDEDEHVAKAIAQLNDTTGIEPA